MKKMICLALVLFGLSSSVAAERNEAQNSKSPSPKEFKIVMDRDGVLSEVRWDNLQIFSPAQATQPNDIPLDPFIVQLPGGPPFPRTLNVGAQVTIAINLDETDNDSFKIKITPQKSKYEIIPIFAGATKPIRLMGVVKKCCEAPRTLASSFILNESGTTYRIEVSRQATLKENETVIFTESLQTRTRYFLGSHVGVFIPFGRSAEYSLAYAGPNDAEATVMENNLRTVTMVFIGTLYPFGFEPESECWSHRRIQFNLAAELSSPIFKRIYFGLGYDFTYFSISLLARFGAIQELRNGFKPGDQVSNSIKTAPTVSKNKLDWGVTLCLPLDLMVGWLGRTLGIK